MGAEKCGLMPDKEIYRQAYEQYRRWSEAEEAERAHDARRLSSQEAWRRYVELVEFCWKLCPQRSEAERQEKLAALERYTESVRRL
ncbi:MAG: hypothetical protein RMK65_06505, partial [Anaerolineae bacterium]|nr:hypothetical protein [Anaerolineae bacterium]